MKKIKTFINKYIPKFSLVSLIIAHLSAIALALAVVWTPFADFFNSTVSVFFRTFMSSLTVNFPISFFEIILVLIPIALILLFVFAAVKLRTRVAAIRFLFGVIAIPAFIFSGYAVALGVPYHITELDERMELDEVEITGDNLALCAEILRDEVNAHALLLGLEPSSASKTKHSFSELSRLITDAYTSFEEEYGFPFNFYTQAKPMLFDELMSSAHLLGIYTFFTGESNINDGYPDYAIPFTVAHEFAHQRGIIRENEANFMAFCVCIRSTSPYIRYSGYLNMYEYVITALYRTDTELYKSVHSGLCSAALSDMRAAYGHSSKYEDSKLGQTVGDVNDAYLKLNGTEGRISYSLSVRLTVAYYNKYNSS